jgi:hypothetical protein
MLQCAFCNRECKNINSHKNHERCCKLNPNRNYKNGMLGKKGSNQYIKAKELGFEVPVYKYPKTRKAAGCSIASTEQKSLWAKHAGTGGYKPNAGHSKKFKVKDSFNNDVVLQSTYELECSLLLNDLGINWIRPKYLNYDNKKYYADFYLPDFDLYLDPKNDYKAKQDAEKIARVCDQNNIKVYVLTKHMLTHEYIRNIVL